MTSTAPNAGGPGAADDAPGRTLAERLFPGDSELARLVRDTDWASTPLGPIDTWPQSLRTAVSIVLYSKFPMIILWGLELVQIYNDPYRLLMGSKHPGGLGQPNRECWPEAWPINQEIYPRVFAGETVGFHEAKYPLAPDGVVHDFYLTLSYSPVRDESGEVAAVFVTVFDVTSEVRTRHERDHALARARAERERLYEVFMQAPAAIAVLEGDDHVFSVANPRYRELVGGRNVLGKKLVDALPEIRGQGFVELLDNVRRTGEPFIAHDARVQLARGNGEIEDVFLDFVYQPLEDADGQVFGVMAHAVETTVQVRARHQLEALAAERRTILSQIADVVISLDAEARISFMNAAAYTIFPGLDTSGSFAEPANGLQFLHLDGTHFPSDELPTARAMRGERVIGEEWLVQHPDGRRLEVQGSAVPLTDDGGNVRGAVLTVRDVTDQRRLQRRLEIQRNRLVEIFQQTPSAIAITQGPDHVFVTTNPVFRQLIGGGRALDGLSVRQAFPELEGQVSSSCSTTCWQPASHSSARSCWRATIVTAMESSRTRT